MWKQHKFSCHTTSCLFGFAKKKIQYFFIVFHFHLLTAIWHRFFFQLSCIDVMSCLNLKTQTLLFVLFCRTVENFRLHGQAEDICLICIVSHRLSSVAPVFYILQGTSCCIQLSLVLESHQFRHKTRHFCFCVVFQYWLHIISFHQFYRDCNATNSDFSFLLASRLRLWLFSLQVLLCKLF